METNRITDQQKAAILVISAAADSNNQLIRRPIYEPFLNSKTLSEIDDSQLNDMRDVARSYKKAN